MDDAVDVAVSFEWVAAGAVRLDGNGRLVFPPVPSDPGLNRVAITNPFGSSALFIGEAANLRRRFLHYRSPGHLQPTNHRIDALLQHVLEDGGRADLAIATRVALLADGVPGSLDLTGKTSRLLAGSAALVNAALAGAARIETL